MRVTVLTPAYNEESVIAMSCAEILRALPANSELLVVDDGSQDNTSSILASVVEGDPRVRVITHAHNRGLGAALASGFADAKGEVVVTMDADLSHPVALLPAMVEGCDTADAVFASRYIKGGGMEGVPWWRQMVSQVANRLLRVALRLPMRDVTTGYRAFRADVVRDMPLVSAGFEVQLEVSARLVADRRTVIEIPLVLRQRAAGMSKMRYFRLLPRYFVALLQARRIRRAG